MLRPVILGAAALAVAGCAQNPYREKNATRVLYGAEVDLHYEIVDAYQSNVHDVVFGLAQIAQIIDVDAHPFQDGAARAAAKGTLIKAKPDDWKKMTRAGFLVVDAACDEYVEAIFWFDRAKDHTIAQMNLIGGTAAAVLGLTGVAAETIAIVAAGFGFTTSTLENIGDSLLYELDPSVLYALMRKNQVVFLNTYAQNEATDKVAALWAIARYAELCKPPAIEAAVTTAIKEATPNAAATSLDGAPPIMGFSISKPSGETLNVEKDVNAVGVITKAFAKDPNKVVAAIKALEKELKLRPVSGSAQAIWSHYALNPDRATFRQKLVAKLKDADKPATEGG